MQGHRRRYLPSTLGAAFEGSGLAVERLLWWGLWLASLMRRQRRRVRAADGESLFALAAPVARRRTGSERLSGCILWYGDGMATSKVTFTLDGITIARLRQAAERLAKPKSQVVREAILDYHERIGKLSEQERLRLLRIFDEVMARIPPRPQGQAREELEEIRRARRTGGRRFRRLGAR